MSKDLFNQKIKMHGALSYKIKITININSIQYTYFIDILLLNTIHDYFIVVISFNITPK